MSQRTVDDVTGEVILAGRSYRMAIFDGTPGGLAAVDIRDIDNLLGAVRARLTGDKPSPQLMITIQTCTHQGELIKLPERPE